MQKKPEPTGGPKDIEKKLRDGLDPNLDLEGDADTRAQAGITLKIQGASWSDIARVLEYPRPIDARNAVERALATASNSEESREHLRVIQDRRYNRLLLSVMTKAIKEDDRDHLAYNARALAIIDRISKLHGLDAAQQVQVTASDETIQSYVERLSMLAKLDTKSVEGEIIDAEVIEGDIN